MADFKVRISGRKRKLKKKSTKKREKSYEISRFFAAWLAKRLFSSCESILTAQVWQGQKDSNPRPMVLETSTLPAELYPYRTHTIILDFCAFVKGFLQNKTENIKKETEDFFLPPFVCHCLLCNASAHGLLSANHARRKNFPPSP